MPSALRLMSPASVPSDDTHTQDTSMLCMLSTMAVILSGKGIAAHLFRRERELSANRDGITTRVGMSCAEDLKLEIAALRESVEGVPLCKSKAFDALRRWYDDALNYFTGAKRPL